MADEKKPKAEENAKDEKMLGPAVDEIHRTLADKMKGRPYLLIVASGFESGKEKDKTVFAAQWAWRSNVYKDKEEGGKLMTFLISQLPDVLDDSEIGVRKSYAPETGRKK